MLNRLKKFFYEYFRSCVDFSLLGRIQKLEDRIRLLENDISSIHVKSDYCFRVVSHLEEELKK